MSPPDWADQEAVEIIARARVNPIDEEMRAWLACKLRIFHENGVGEGIERLSKAMTAGPEEAGSEETPA